VTREIIIMLLLYPGTAFGTEFKKEKKGKN
jgi:hypothetical protein